MKIIISCLLKYPLYFVLLNGIVALTGINIWLAVPVSVGIVLLYRLGQRYE